MGVPVILRTDNTGRLDNNRIKIVIPDLIKYVLGRLSLCFGIGPDNILRCKMIGLRDSLPSLSFGDCVYGTDIYQFMNLLFNAHIRNIFGALHIDLIDQWINSRGDRNNTGRMNDDNFARFRYPEKWLKRAFITHISLENFNGQTFHRQSFIGKHNKPADPFFLLQKQADDRIAQMSGCAGNKINRIHKKIRFSPPNKGLSALYPSISIMHLQLGKMVTFLEILLFKCPEKRQLFVSLFTDDHLPAPGESYEEITSVNQKNQARCNQNVLGRVETSEASNRFIGYCK